MIRPASTRRPRRTVREPEQIYDGQQFLGSILQLPAGFEAFGPDESFLGTFEQHHEATAALKSIRVASLVRVGVAR